MAAAANVPITSSELGTLWMTYQMKSMMLKILGYFIEKTNDKGAKKIMLAFSGELEKLISEIENVFNDEKAVIPIAFDDNDVRKDAPPMFDDMFYMMFLRIMMKISLGLNALHFSMSLRKDVRGFYERAYKSSQDTYNECTDYLTGRGVLARPPYISMPREVEFIEDTSYISGFKVFKNKRTLNTIEVAFIYYAIESNIMGIQLMTGFAQVAKEREITDYFIKGKELAKKIYSVFSDLLLQSDIQPSGTWAGKATDSTVSPFSDKIMMFCTSLISSYALGSNAVGSSFSMRSDLPAKLLTTAADTLAFAKEGGKIMIRHKWMEEPPQMEDRNQLVQLKK